MTQDDPHALIRQAQLHRQSERLEAAVAAYQRARDHGVAHPEAVHLNRGVICACDSLVSRLQREIETSAVVAAAVQAGPGFARGKPLDGCAAQGAKPVSNRCANEYRGAHVGRTGVQPGDC